VALFLNDQAADAVAITRAIPKAKAKGKGKATPAPLPKAKAKGKAQPKAKAKAKAQPKAKAKAKAKAHPTVPASYAGEPRPMAGISGPPPPRVHATVFLDYWARFQRRASNGLAAMEDGGHDVQAPGALAPAALRARLVALLAEAVHSFRAAAEDWAWIEQAIADQRTRE
jgi:hypothetical protein